MSPWRSTKWAARMGKPDTAVKNGETQCNPKAAVHRVHWSRPWVKPAKSSSAAVMALAGPNRRMARTALSWLDSRNIPVCTSVTSRYPTPKATPPPSKAVGIASATTRNPPMPSSSSNRSTGSRGGTALVSHA
jgi:hypothetical protein